MTAPNYREIVMVFGAFKALIGNMSERGLGRVSLHIECDEGDAARMASLMRSPDMTPDRSAYLFPMQMFGITVTWGPKQ